MEKYAVDVVVDVKVAGDKSTVTAVCAACGSPLEISANVPKCPRCGTEPYEPNESKTP